MKKEIDIRPILDIIHKFIREYSSNFNEFSKTKKNIQSASRILFSQETLVQNLSSLGYECKNADIYNEVLAKLNFTKNRYEELKCDHLSQSIFIGTFQREYNSALSFFENFKEKKLINISELKIIYDLLTKLNIPKKDIIEFMLYIEKYNNKFPRHIEFFNTNEMHNFQKYGFINIKTINYHDPLIKEKAASILKLLGSYQNINDKAIKEVLDSVLLNVDTNRLIYYLSSVINAIQDTILELINLLSEKEVFFDIDMRLLFSEDIHKNQKLLNIFINYIDSIINNKIEPVEEKVEKTKDERMITFSGNNNSIYLLSDIEKYSKEELEQVEKLLIGFKNNTLSSAQSVISKIDDKKTIMLKGFQVRIICSHIQGKTYNIHGSFIKKKNGHSYEMSEIRKRPISKENKEVEENFSLVLSLCNKK